MTLAAVYFKDHFLFREEEIINFGGKYIYDFFLKVNTIEVKRKANINFIEDFFGDNISLISAIVGSNGAGKTSLINSILLNFNNKSIGIIDCGMVVMIFEEEDVVNIVFINHSKKAYVVKTIDFKSNPTNTKVENISTIFYTPILDIREFYINFSNSHFIDVSKYRLFQNDTEDEEDGGFSKLSEFHLSENLKRWINFSNELGQNFKSDLNYLNKFDSTEIVINRVFSLLKDRFNDTSYAFRDFALKFYSKWQNEFHKNEKVTNQERLKLNLILSVIEKTYNILEKTGNRYLEEGRVSISVDEIQDIGLKESFYLFLEKHSFTRYKDVHLPVKEIKDLIEILINNIPEEIDIKYNHWQNYNVDFATSLVIIQAYKKFIKEFSNHFTLDNTIMLTFRPSIDLSSGEKGLLDLFSSFHSIETDILQNEILIFIDEGDTFFHPNWKIKFVNSMVENMPKIFKNKKVQIVFTTHEPLTLSDMPNDNIIYLDKKNEEARILKGIERPQKSFGANITDLLADSFFVNQGLVGQFAKRKINDVIKWLNDEQKDLLLKEKYRKIIEIIDEPLVKSKLMDMYFKIFPKEFDIETETEKVRKRAVELGIIKE